MAAAAAAAAAAKAKQQKICTWSDLPTDLVVSILKKLSIVDHIRFGAVCAAWHSVWKRRLCRPAPTRVPWLMMFSAGLDNADGARIVGDGARSFFDLATGKTYTMGLPELHGRHCVGTSVDGGWVIHDGDDYEIGLLHLATRRSLPLPPLSTLLLVQNIERDREGRHLNRFSLATILRSFFRKALVMTSLDGSPGCGRTPPLVVLVHCANPSGVSVCRPGDGAWTELECAFGNSDVVFHKGRLCAVDYRGNAFAWGPCDPPSSPPPVAWSKPEPLGPAMNDRDLTRKYLVSDGGDLWQVWRDARIIDDPDTYDVVMYETSTVRAFKLDPAGDRWSEVKSLDGRVFFLGNNHPVVRSAAVDDDAGWKNCDCIYFTDDSLSEQVRRNHRDVGVYSLEDGSWEPLPLPAGAMYPSAIWATPSLHH